MGDYLSTDITSPQVVAAGGQLTGNITAKSPSAGHFYLVMEQYTAGLALIPGSRAYLHQVVAGGPWVNSTVHYTVITAVAAGETATDPVALTLPNTDCYLYVFLKQITHIVPAGSFVVGNTYKILSIGTTDFTLIGAASNTPGLEFIATGVGAGTGTACVTPDPDTDDTVDYVVVAIQSSAGALDVGAIMNLMVTVMIVVMMMKMMTGIIVTS